MTKHELIKAKLLDTLRFFLASYETDLTTGLEEGIYKKEDNAETLQLIEDTKATIAEFETMQPEIYVYISGGNLQGISATENIHAHLFDQDNLDAEDTDTVTIHNGEDEYKTPEQWDAMIAEKTKAGEIIGIY